MATTDSVAPVIYALLGAGGVGGLSILVSAYRSFRQGKIEDEGTLLQRLNSDNVAQRERAKRAEDSRDDALKARNAWMSQAAIFEVQLIRAGIEPKKLVLPELAEDFEP